MQLQYLGRVGIACGSQIRRRPGLLRDSGISFAQEKMIATEVTVNAMTSPFIDGDELLDAERL